MKPCCIVLMNILKANAEFAITVDGMNQDLIQRKSEVDDLRRNLIPTVPTQLHLEKKTNPFLGQMIKK